MNAWIKTKKYCQAYSKRDERYWEHDSTVHVFCDGLKLSRVCAKKCTVDLKNSCFETAFNAEKTTFLKILGSYPSGELN